MSSESESISKITLADRLAVPAETKALLFDMDGVLLDTLTLDFKLVNVLLDRHSPGMKADPGIIRRHFALDPLMFFPAVFSDIGIRLSDEEANRVANEYVQIRGVEVPDIHQGIAKILRDARSSELRLAVVSNNVEADVEQLLKNVDLLASFDTVVGNDMPGMKKKPAPDPYLEGARRLGVDPSECVVIEDSLIGAQAGRAAGCFVIGVATGTNSIEEMTASPFIDECYAAFVV